MRTVHVGLAILVITAFGCGQSAPPAAPTASAPVAPPPTPTPPPAPEVTTPPPAPEGDPNDPVAALNKALKRRPRPTREKAEVVITATEPEKVIEQLGQAVADRKLQAIWEILPSDYQAELTNLIVDFGNKMDPKVWEEITGTVQLGVFTLRAQKERFFKHPVSEQLPIPKDTLEKSWDSIVDLGEALLDSQLYDIEDVKTFDPAAFLAKTGPALIDHLPTLAEVAAVPPAQELLNTFNELKGIKAEKVSGDETTAVVKISVPGRDPIEVTMVIVGGKWIPKQLQEQWATFMGQIKDAMAMIPTPDKKEDFDKFKGQIATAKVGVMILAGANTDELFDRQVRGLWKLILKEDFPVPPPGKEAGPEKPAPPKDEAPKSAEAPENK